MVAEMTDSTNIAEVISLAYHPLTCVLTKPQAYAYMPLSWSSGGTVSAFFCFYGLPWFDEMRNLCPCINVHEILTIPSSLVQLGPMIGGFLSRPADQFPKLFGQSEFHRKYPYFLACSVPATFTAVAWLVTFLFLKETNEKAIGMKQYIMDLFRRTRSDGPLLTSKKTPRLSVDQTIDPIIRSSTHSVSPSQSSSTDSLYKADNKVLITTTVVEVDLPTPSNSSTISVDDDDQQKEQTLPLRAILTRPVIISAGNYATLSLIDIAFRSIQPVFLSTPIEMGGLGLQPATIGNLLSVFGVLNGIVQVRDLLLPLFSTPLLLCSKSGGVLVKSIESAVRIFSRKSFSVLYRRSETLFRFLWLCGRS